MLSLGPSRELLFQKGDPLVPRVGWLNQVALELSFRLLLEREKTTSL